MARGYTTRKLEVFSLSGHVGEGAADYGALFRRLAKLDDEKRSATVGEKLVAFSRIEITKGVAWFVAYEGVPEQRPLLFNVARGRERFGQLRADEVVAHKTHVLVDLSRREALIEYNHRGAKASDIAEVVQSAGRTLSELRDLTFDLVAVGDESFLKAVDRFTRIRIASIRVARPNPGWTDCYDELGDLGKKSKAQTITVEMTAQRNDTLSKSDGIIGVVRDLIKRKIAALKGARVVGQRGEEPSETTVSLDRYIVHRRVNVRKTEEGHVDDADIRRHMEAFGKSRRRSGGDS